MRALLMCLAALLTASSAIAQPRTPPPPARPPITPSMPSTSITPIAPPSDLAITPAPPNPRSPAVTPITPAQHISSIPSAQSNGRIEFYGQCPAAAVPAAAQRALTRGDISPGRFSECVATLRYSAMPLQEACGACAE